MCDPNQQQNIFAMFQRDNRCYYPQVRIDFSNVQDQTATHQKGFNVYKKIIPTFNNDKLYYTDAFVIELELIETVINGQLIMQVKDREQIKEKFEKRIDKVNQIFNNLNVNDDDHANSSEQFEQENVQNLTLLQRVQPESLYCQICREGYENYHQHIVNRDHRRNFQFSKGNKFIKEICKQARKNLQVYQCQETNIKKIGVVKRKRKGKGKIIKKKDANLMKSDKKDIKNKKVDDKKDDIVAKQHKDEQTDGSKKQKNENFNQNQNNDNKQS